MSKKNKNPTLRMWGNIANIRNTTNISNISNITNISNMANITNISNISNICVHRFRGFAKKFMPRDPQCGEGHAPHF